MADEGTTTTSATATAPPPAAGETAAPPPATTAPFDWKTAGLATEHLNLVTERGWKSPDDVMKSYRNLETATGVPPERLIKLPAAKDAADPKVWNDIYAKLGRPETAEKYVIPVPEGDKGEFAGLVKPWMHEAGLSQAQATKLAGKWNEHIATTTKAQQTELEASIAKDVTALKQAWGTDYDARAALVDKAAEAFGMTPEHYEAFKVAMGPKAAMEFLYNIGSKIAVEDKTVPGMGNQNTSLAMTPEMALAKIAEYKQKGSDMSKLLTSTDPRTRREAKDELNRLYQIAAPGSTPISHVSGPRK